MIQPIPTNPNGGGVRPPSRAVVYKFIRQACDRNRIVFEMDERQIAEVVRNANYDELVEVSFYSMIAGLSREVLIQKCRALGLE